MRALEYAWYPAVFGLGIACFTAGHLAGVPLLLTLYGSITLAGAAIVALELLQPERPEWRPRFSDVRTDIAFMAVVQVLVPRLLTPLVVLVAAAAMHEPGSGPWPHHWPLAVQVAVVLLLVDFMRYWLHRACHTFTPLWRLHEVHHSPDILYTLNTARFHPLEKVFHFALDTVPFVLLGVAPEVLAGYFLMYAVNGFFQHSNVRLRHGVVNYLMSTAELHRWHHARDPETARCNFSNTTIVWDLLFGTWHLPAGERVEIGIPDRGYPRGFWQQMLSPFRIRS